MAKVDSLHWKLENVRNQTGKQKKLRDIRENDFNRKFERRMDGKDWIAQKVLHEKERVLTMD